MELKKKHFLFFSIISNHEIESRNQNCKIGSPLQFAVGKKAEEMLSSMKGPNNSASDQPLYLPFNSSESEIHSQLK